MQEYLLDTDHEAYISGVYMKKNIQGHFGERIVITKLNGKNNKPKQEKMRIIRTAASPYKE